MQMIKPLGLIILKKGEPGFPGTSELSVGDRYPQQKCPRLHPASIMKDRYRAGPSCSPSRVSRHIRVASLTITRFRKPVRLFQEEIFPMIEST